MGEARDRGRVEILAQMGIKILRYSDRDVFEHIGAVIEEIWNYLNP